MVIGIDDIAVGLGALNTAKSLFGGSGPSPRALQAQANDFTREMMTSKVQWAASDFEKAGFNRMLATGINPSMGSSQAAQYVNPVDNFSKASAATTAAQLARAQISNMRADTALKGAQAGSAEAATALANMNSAQVAQNMAITKPASDLARGVGDLSSSALGLWRRFQRDPMHTEFPNPLKFFKR